MNGGEVLWSGEEKDHKRRVGFLLSEKAKRALLGYKLVGSRKSNLATGLLQDLVVNP